MKRLTVVLGLGLVAGVVGYGLVRVGLCLRSDDVVVSTGADITWLKSEFHLNDEQFAAIKQLHGEYGSVCAVHCANIVEAQDRLADLRERGASAEDLAVARQSIEDLEAVCNAATRAHIRRVADLMPPDQGRRFLSMTEPHLASMPHNGSRGLDR